METTDANSNSWECNVLTIKKHSIKSSTFKVGSGQQEEEIEITFDFNDKTILPDSAISTVTIRYDTTVIASLLLKDGFVDKSTGFMCIETDVMKSKCTIFVKRFSKKERVGRLERIIFSSNASELAQVCKKSLEIK